VQQRAVAMVTAKAMAKAMSGGEKCKIHK